MASNVTKVAAISGWNGLDGSMGSGGHVRCLDLVMGDLGTFLASNATKGAVISGWNGLDGSMGPGGHIQSLDLVIGALQGAQCVRNDSLRGSFLA